MLALRDDIGSYGESFSALVIADSEMTEERCRRAVAAISGRTVRHLTPREIASGTASGIGFDVVLAEIERADIRAISQICKWLNTETGSGCAGVVSVSLDALDLVESLLSQENTILLCQPSDWELAAALSMCAMPKPPILRDSGGDNDDRPLLRLSEEVGRIARVLAELSHHSLDETGSPSQLAAPSQDYGAEPSHAPLMTADDIRAMIRLRRMRDRFFRGGLFPDPAWDMLLDLMAARIEGRDVSVSSLCIAAAVPPTTALRWIKVMTENGLFERISDPNDGRRIYIALSDGAAHAMEAWFAAARAGAEPIAV